MNIKEIIKNALLQLKPQQVYSSGPAPKPSPTVNPPTQPEQIARQVIQQVSRPQQNPSRNAVQMARNPNGKDFNISDTVKLAIEMAAKKYDIPASLLYDIALQESSFDPKKRNPQQGVTAQGLFQFNDPTWETVRKYDADPKNSIELANNNRMDPVTSAMAAAYLIKHGQLGRWDASKGVWGQHYKPEELKSYYSQTK